MNTLRQFILQHGLLFPTNGDIGQLHAEFRIGDDPRGLGIDQFAIEAVGIG